MSTNKQLLSDFATAITIPVYYTDGVKWPFKSGIALKPVTSEYGEYYTSLFDALDKPSKVFDNAGQLVRCSHHFINGMKSMGLENGEIAERLVKLANAIIELQGGNYFIEYGDYRVTDKVNVERALKTPLLLRLATALWAYSETLYFVHRQTACEYHGNYKLPDGNNAIVRDFCNLKPTDLWGNFDFADVPNTIQIATAHNQDLKTEFDNYNNLYVRKGSMVESLEFGHVLVDGNQITGSEVADLLDVISDKLTKFHIIIENMDDIAIKHKYLDIFWYRSKPMADALRRDWKPSKEIHAKADIAFNIPEAPPSYRPQETFEEFRKQFDYSKFA